MMIEQAELGRGGPLVGRLGYGAMVLEGYYGASDDKDAVGVVHEISTVKKTQMNFEIEFIQWLKVRNGKIVRWKSYTDPSSIILAINGGKI